MSGLAKVELDPFGYEHEMRDFVADNIGVLFTGLEKVKNELTIKDYRFDTIAYDHNQNTFVVIEYKNKVAKDAVTQVMAYATTIRNNQADLVVAHTGMSNEHKYDWNAVYSIIVAPSFDRVVKDAVQDKGDMELYTIKRYGNRIVAVERAGGGHERTVAIESAPSPGAEAARTQVAVHAPSPGTSSPQTEHLYNTIRARLLEEFSGAEEHKTKVYHGFRYPSGECFCTIAMYKSKILLSYSGKRAASELKPDGFVRNINGWGIGKLRSEIKNENDFEKALLILKRLHDDHERPDIPVTIFRESPNPPQMISIKEWKVQRGVKPTHVVFPGKPIMEVGSWIDVHAEAIDWLIDTGKFNKYGQVTTKSGWILYTSDEAYTRKQRRTRKTRYGWFDCNRNVENHIADITKLFEHAGVDMDFKIAIQPKEV